MSSSTQNVTVLFADVSGSTRLYETLGDTEALKQVEQCLDILRTVTKESRGRVIKTIGDEIMAVFPSADLSVQAACEMQARISALPAINAKARLAIRVGLHYGPVIEENNDVFGDAVNLASRMAGLAKAGQIITSQETIAALSPALKKSARDLDFVSVKGKAEAINICEIIWQPSDEMTQMASEKSQRLSEVGLRLEYGDTTLVLNNKNPLATLGRDSQTDLPISDKKASRLHAKIEKRRDKFVLIDQSTNGTYVTINGADEILLRHEELVLRSSGIISFGHSATEPHSEVVKFAYE